MKTKDRGFTLIELLVVIAIIGILATVVLASLDDARSSARDAKRKADLKGLKVALELNYQKYGAYTQPEALWLDTSCGELGGASSCPGSDWAANSDMRELIADGFINELPVDPINNYSYNYYYEPSNPGEHGYPSAGAAYLICANLEAGGNYCVGAGWPGVNQ